MARHFLSFLQSKAKMLIKSLMVVKAFLNKPEYLNITNLIDFLLEIKVYSSDPELARHFIEYKIKYLLL